MKPREWYRLDPDQRQILEKYISECPVKVGQIARDLGVDIKVTGLRMGISGSF